MKLHKPTVKWCLRRLIRTADGTEALSHRTNWDDTIIVSPAECAARADMVRRLANVIKDKAKRKWKWK